MVKVHSPYKAHYSSSSDMLCFVLGFITEVCKSAVGTSVPSQHGVTGTGFVFLPEITKKLYLIYATALCEILNIRQWRMMISEKGKQWSESYKCPSSPPHRVCRLWPRKGDPSEAQQMPWLRRWSWESGEIEAAGVYRTEYLEKRELHRGRTLRRCSPLRNLAERRSVYAWRKIP